MRYIHLSQSDQLPIISGVRPFKAVIIVAEPVPAERRDAISQWLVDAGCLYVMTWGPDSAAWEAAVQQVNRDAHVADEIPDDQLVMTTSHTQESLQDIFWFSKYTAMHPCCEITMTVLLDLAPARREKEIRAQYDAV